MEAATCEIDGGIIVQQLEKSFCKLDSDILLLVLPCDPFSCPKILLPTTSSGSSVEIQSLSDKLYSLLVASDSSLLVTVKSL